MATTKEYCFDLEQFSQNALAIKIKNDVIDKLLACTTKQEVQDTLNNIITQNYETLDIEKVRTGNAVINAALDNFVTCSLEETAEGLTNIQIEIGQLLKNAIDLVCNPPDLEIPAPYPIFDISGDFLKRLLNSLLRLIIKIIIAIIKKLLQMIIEFCQSGLSAQNYFGGQNIGTILSSVAFPAVQAGIEEAQQGVTKFINQVFFLFGIEESGVPTTELLEGEGCVEKAPYDTSNIKSGMQFLDDLSSIITPLEICDLFEGVPSDETLQVIEELIKFEYSNNMGLALNTRTRIKDLFILLGSKVDPIFCSTIRDNAEALSSSPDLCFTEDGVEVRRRFLGDKGLPDEEIEEAIRRERERQKRSLEQLSYLASSLRNNPDRIFGNNQEIFCRNGQQGIVTTEDMPHLRDNLSSTLDYTYNIFFRTYKSELDTFSSTLLTQDKKINQDEPVIPKFTTLSFTDSSGEQQTVNNALNPTFLQKTSFGSFTLCDDAGNSDISSLSNFYPKAVDDDGNIDTQKVISVTSKKEARELLGSTNVYIVNFINKEKIANDLYDNQYGFYSSSSVTIDGERVKRIKDFMSYDINNMSITINIPNKFVPFGQEQTIPDFSSVVSQDNIVVYVTGTV